MKTHYDIEESKAMFYLKQGILLLTLLALFLPLVGLRNSPLLAILGGVGLYCFFLPKKNRLSAYGWICIAYFLYLLLSEWFIFNEYRTIFLRRAVPAFFSGTAAYYVLRAPTPSHLNLLPAALLLAIGVGLAGMGLGLFEPEKFLTNDRLHFFIINPNNLGYMVSLAFVIGLAYLLNRRNEAIFFSTPGFVRIWSRLSSPGIVLAGSLAALTMLWLSNSRIAMVAALASAIAALFFRLKIKTAILCAATGLSLFLAVLFLPPALGLYDNPALARVRQMVAAPWNDPTFRSRLPIWESAWHSAQKSPMLGHGPQSFARITHPHFVREHYEELCAKYGQNVIDNDTTNPHHVHNQFLQILTEQGLLGLIFLLILVLYPLNMAMRHKGLGVLGPLLVHFLVCSLAQTPLDNNRLAVTVLFSSFGYFACVSFNKQKINTPA